ncbi:MAG: hypothetical protein QOF99_8636, partial [Pseudonocardiales bacterium]|nr:hypothetical protein [Pseudonocardiales bacterium]
GADTSLGRDAPLISEQHPSTPN